MSSQATSIRPAERHVFFEAPLYVLAAFVLIETVLPDTSKAFAGWPLVISLFLVGMPHGAADLAVNSYLCGSGTLMEKVTRFSGYLVLLAASLTFFLVSPSSALILFVLTSALHFGLADARDLERRQSTSTPPLLTRLAALSRGGFVLGLPFVIATSESLDVFSNIIALTGRSIPAIDSSMVALVAGVAVSGAVICQCGLTIVRWQRNEAMTAGLELLETSVLTLSFFFLHPLFAIGLYVLAWHSWRHMYSLTQFLPATKDDGRRKNFLRPIVRLHIDSLPLLIPTVAVFGIVAWWRLEVWSSEQLAALTVAFFAVVTLPHHLLVERLFRHIRGLQGSGAVTDARRFPGTAGDLTTPPHLRIVDVSSQSPH